jgi:hypothetical protein
MQRDRVSWFTSRVKDLLGRMAVPLIVILAITVAILECSGDGAL